MNYNPLLHNSFIAISIIVLVLSLFFMVVSKSKLSFLKLLPFILLFDIPLNQISHIDKPFFPFRIWFLYIVLLFFLYHKEFISILIKARFILLIMIMLPLFQVLIGGDVMLLRGWAKVAFIYLPLIIGTCIYCDYVSVNDKAKYIFLACLMVLTISIIQLLSFHVFNYNLFILELFHKPSATFSEPVWSGTVMGALLILYELNKRNAKVWPVLPVLLFLGSKSTLVFYLLSKIRLKVSRLVLYSLLLSLFVYLVFWFELIPPSLLLESVIIHSGNWIVAADVFNHMNFLQKLFGIGFGQSGLYIEKNDLLANMNLLSIADYSDKEFDFSYMVSSFGGDVSNILLEAILSIGLVGALTFFTFIYGIYKKINPIAKSGVKFFFLVSLIHPFYFLGYGVFFLTFMLIFKREE